MKDHNRPYLKKIRKHLRNHSTSAEAELWNILKHRNLGGLKFRRQHSVGKYILDFYCPDLRLAIELDGEPHADLQNIIRDEERDSHLMEYGITVFRYENRWAFEYPEVIKEDILEFAGRKKSIN